MPLAQWICSIIGVNLMNDYAWFPIVLFLLYLAFYLIFKNEKNRKTSFVLIFLVTLLLGAIFAVRGHFGWWAGDKNWWLSQGGFIKAKWWMQEKTLLFYGEWWVNSAIGFLIGMLVAQYEEGIVAFMKKHYWIKEALLIALAILFHSLARLAQAKIGYYNEWAGNGPAIADKFLTFLCQMPAVVSFVLAVFGLMMKFKSSNPVTRFFGKYSLDTYLMNLMPIMYFRFLLYRGSTQIKAPYNWNMALYAVCVIIVSVLLALLERWIVNGVKKVLLKEKKA